MIEIASLLASFAALALPMSLVFILVKRPWLPPQRVRACFWGGGTVLMSFCLLFMLGSVVQQIFPDRDDEALRLLKSLCVSMLSLLMGLLPLATVFSVQGNVAFNSSSNEISYPRRIAVGFLTWLAIVPLVLIVANTVRPIFHGLFPNATKEHFLIGQLRARSGDDLLWLLIAAEAVVFAPVREELFFRGVLQPWVLKRPWAGDLMFALAGLAGFTFGAQASLLQSLIPVAYVVLVYGTLQLFERLPARTWPRWYFPPLPRGSAFHGPDLRRGIVGVAVLFAMIHVTSWPDPIPLTLFGLALGWLAYRTQSITAPLVCHALFNAVNLGQLRFLTWWTPSL